MIYLLYIAEDSGIPIWKYEHPRTPNIILEHIVGKDDAIIVGYLSSISHFSKVILGEYIQSIRLGHYNMHYWYFELLGKKLIGLVVCDAKDNKEAVQSTVFDFLKRGEALIKELMTESSKPNPSQEKMEILSRRLEGLFQSILDKRTRTPTFLAYRDIKNIVIGSALAYIFFLFMLYLTVSIEKRVGWIERGEFGILLVTISILDLILPSLVLGYIIGYREGAYKSGLLTGIAILSTLLILWHPYVISWAKTWKLGLFTFPIFIVIVIVLGGAIGMIAANIAELLVERRYLVPPLEQEIALEEVTKEEAVAPEEIEESQKNLE